jgi:hypothetical protein
MEDESNNGLHEPIEVLHPIYEKYYYSKADIWAIAAVVAAELALPHKGKYSIKLLGRKDHYCTGSEKGMGGPYVELPSAHIGTHQVLDYFYKYFGFDQYETVAIMGVHSAGKMHREYSGFGNDDGEAGWVPHSKDFILSSVYYCLLIHERWEQKFVDNSDYHGVDNRYQVRRRLQLVICDISV